jgi:hypothetical protein
MNWYVQCCLWLARLGGWQLPVPLTLTPEVIVLPDKAVAAERDTLRADLKALQGLLHVKDTKIQMRDVKVHELEDRITKLERDLAGAKTVSFLSLAPSVNGVMFDRVKELVAATDESLATASGEAKRHAVYARLLKEYPTTPKRDLALAIETALIAPPKEG